MLDRRFIEKIIREIVVELEAGIRRVELCKKDSLEQEIPKHRKEQDCSALDGESGVQDLEEKNRILKDIVATLMIEKQALLQHRVCTEQMKEAKSFHPRIDLDQDSTITPELEPNTLNIEENQPVQTNKFHAEPVRVQVGPTPVAEMQRNARCLLEQSRVIPAVRSTEFIPAAMASPTLIVSLLFGNPMTIEDVVNKLRAAGKLAIANLDLMTGFAQDSDAVSLLVKCGVAGIVSTRQSVLRAARSQGIVAVQRTFAVDSIALRNITRVLHHFVPDAIELLPAVAAPLYVASVHAAAPDLPVIATGLVNSLRQVEELVQSGVTSVATSNSSLWIL